MYMNKNYELSITGLNNTALPILLTVVNNIEQVVEPEYSPQSDVTILNSVLLATLNNEGSTKLFNPVFNKLLEDTNCKLLIGGKFYCHICAKLLTNKIGERSNVTIATLV